jgi:hypothetical protein
MSVRCFRFRFRFRFRGAIAIAAGGTLAAAGQRRAGNWGKRESEAAARWQRCAGEPGSGQIEGRNRSGRTEGGNPSGWRYEQGIGARSAAGGMTALSLRRSVREHRFQMHHYRYCAGDPLKNWRFEPLSLAYFSLRRQREVGAAPHRGNANKPLTKQGKAKRPTSEQTTNTARKGQRRTTNNRLPSNAPKKPPAAQANPSIFT